MGRTLAEKIWDAHVVRSAEGEPDLLYIDLHLLHEVTSPQAFDGLRAASRKVRRPDLTIATEDHNVPTTGITGPGVPRWLPIPLFGPGSPFTDPVSRTQVEALRKNCAEFGVRLHPMGDADQGIVHVIGPQLGLTQPGLTIVCGDSHTSTHGALGALAFGIGTSEVEHVLATQTLPQQRPKTMAITVNGALPDGVSAKDLILAIIAKIGTGGGQGYVLEYRGPAIRALSMAGRLTVCNMSIEAGARAGLVAPDDVTFSYLEGRPHAPSGAAWEAALDHWRTLPSDEDARFDNEVVLDAGTLTPYVTWGTNPGQALPLAASVPDPASFADPGARAAAERALTYMDLVARHRAARHQRGHGLRRLLHQRPDRGPAGRRLGAAGTAGGAVGPDAGGTRIDGGAGPGRTRRAGRGLHRGRRATGGSAGCSMCLGMNPDKLSAGERSASTSNRNFEGRQGKGGRTHLVSPEVAAATAVTGHLAAPADL